MNLKIKLRFCQLTVRDPEEIIIPLTNEGIFSLWEDNEYWQKLAVFFERMTSNNYPQSKRITFIKRTIWVFPHIIRKTSICGAPMFYIDVNKSGKARYKSGNLSKVVQSPYNSGQKSELYVILMLLMDFTESLNIITDS